MLIIVIVMRDIRYASERVPLVKLTSAKRDEKIKKTQTKELFHSIAVCPLRSQHRGSEKICIEWNVTKIHSTT